MLLHALNIISNIDNTSCSLPFLRETVFQRHVIQRSNYYPKKLVERKSGGKILTRKGKGKAFPLQALGRPLGFQEVETS
jgi:hypothetical protein